MITREAITGEMRRVIAGRYSEAALDMAEALAADGYSTEDIQEAIKFAFHLSHTFNAPLRGITVRKLPTVRTVRLGRPS